MEKFVIVVHLMIVLSDNTATNMILQRFTVDAVNAYLCQQIDESVSFEDSLLQLRELFAHA